MLATLSEDLHYLLLYSIAGVIMGLAYILIGCVCNPRSRRFAKHKSFILSHDVGALDANSVPAQHGDIAAAGQDLLCQNADMTGSITGPGSYLNSNTTPNSVVRSSVLSSDMGQSNPVNRALPDIPANGDIPTDASGDNLASYADIISNSADEVDSIYTVAQNDNREDSSNHAYARIRDNRDNNHHFVDSSTENDTDDYGDTRNVIVCVTSTINSTPASSIITIQSNSGNSSGIITNSQAPAVHHPPHILRLQITNNPMEGPVFHHHHHHQQAIPLPSVDDVHRQPPAPPPPPPPPQQQQHQHQEQQSEISYNTISVREPLSKVLTEPNDIDVEHHYNEVEEERLSSFYEEINSGNSSTYYKINYENHSQPGPSGIGAGSASTSGMHQASTSKSSTVNTPSLSQTPMGVAFIDQTTGPTALYSFVEKKSKRNKLPSSNLYTMVNKPSTSKSNDHSKLNGNSAQILERYSPPPPLPPPIPKEQPGTSSQKIGKNYRNTMFGGLPSSLLEEENIYQKIALSDSEKDPGYETVDKDGHDDDDCLNDSSKMVDYGYEVVNNDECDPAYEMVKPPDPAYETIKNEVDYAGSTSSQSVGDPNYEIIANPMNDSSSLYGHGLSVLTPNESLQHRSLHHHSHQPPPPTPQPPPPHPPPHHHHYHSQMQPLPRPGSNSLPFYATVTREQPSNIPPALIATQPESLTNIGSLHSHRQHNQPNSIVLPPPHMHSIIVNNNNNSTNSSIILDENVIIEHL